MKFAIINIYRDGECVGYVVWVKIKQKQKSLARVATKCTAVGTAAAQIEHLTLIACVHKINQ